MVVRVGSVVVCFESVFVFVGVVVVVLSGTRAASVGDCGSGGFG